MPSKNVSEILRMQDNAMHSSHVIKPTAVPQRLVRHGCKGTYRSIVVGLRGQVLLQPVHQVSF